MNHHDSVFLKNRIWGIEDGQKSWNFHQTVSSLCSIQEKKIKKSIQEKIIKFKFSSECVVQSQNNGDFARKNPPQVGQYKNFEMHS